MSELITHVTDADFENEVLKSELPVLVDFWAAWCGPCRAIAPTIEELAHEFAGKVKMTKLDVDSNQKTAIQYNIRSIPTLMVFKAGDVVATQLGAVSKGVINKMLEQAL